MVALLAGCSSAPSPDPLLDVRNPELSISKRIRAVDASVQLAAAGEIEPQALRRALKSLAWSDSTAPELRVACLEALLDDRTPEGQADTRAMIRLMLPRERNTRVVHMLAQEAVARGWTDVTPSLVRRYAFPQKGVPDENRVERAAIQALHPTRPVEETVFDVFLSAGRSPGEEASEGPGEEPDSGFGANWVLRTRVDAWDLLARLDKDGALRLRLFGVEASRAATDDPLLGDMHACLRDLGTLPLTGEELRWLTQLRDEADAASLRWWDEARAAVSPLSAEQRHGLRLRHAEPVRWAAAHRAEWMGMSRSALLSELQRRMLGREVTHRSGEWGTRGRGAEESLSAWSDTLAWGDILTLLVVDEATRDPRVVRSIARQAEGDRADRTTEYGGLIHSYDVPGADAGLFRAVLYPPRAILRRGDAEFTASPEMIADGARALAHYHLHAQRENSRAFAGPSPGDLDYAARTGRTCVVFTTLGGGEIGVDCYFSGGVVVDLGRVSAAAEPGAQ